MKSVQSIPNEGYKKLYSKILKGNSYSYVSFDTSDIRYNNLIDEACKRSTGFIRRMEIKEELKTIRSLRRSENLN